MSQDKTSNDSQPTEDTQPCEGCGEPCDRVEGTRNTYACDACGMIFQPGRRPAYTDARFVEPARGRNQRPR